MRVHAACFAGSNSSTPPPLTPQLEHCKDAFSAYRSTFRPLIANSWAYSDITDPKSVSVRKLRIRKFVWVIRKLQISLVSKTKNRSDPRRLPCGTPENTSSQDKNFLFIVGVCYQLLAKHSGQSGGKIWSLRKKSGPLLNLTIWRYLGWWNFLIVSMCLGNVYISLICTELENKRRKTNF